MAKEIVFVIQPLKILPIDQVAQSPLKPKTEAFSFAHMHPNVFFTESGKSAIRTIAEFHDLGREDEAYVVTTSDSPFVSSCVTSTLFNFCKVSRVLTNKTRLIFVVHEFGFACARLKELGEVARKRGIPLVEDIAHSLTSSFEERPLGTVGDYAIHSLPKSIPIDNGGILLSRSKDIGINLLQNEAIEEAFVKQSLMLKWVHTRRRSLFEKFQSHISKPQVYQLWQGCNPFCFAYKDEPLKVINTYQAAERFQVELLRTHNPEWVTIPLNPWFTDADVERIADIVKGVK
jgi:dTDP-4-amino-4,6-dideoxygalactose transaminase